jgi:hypothetical protein
MAFCVSPTAFRAVSSRFFLPNKFPI